MKIPDRFMIIDDDKTTILLCEHALRKFSKETPYKVFMEPEVALEEIKEEYGKADANIVTVLFLDINMFSMSGWEFLELFKDFNERIHKQFTIYMLSSSIDQRDKEKSVSNPFVSGLISKPLTEESIKHIFDMVNNKSIISFNKINEQ